MNELKERCREIDEGKVDLIPGEEGLTRLQGNLRRNARNEEISSNRNCTVSGEKIVPESRWEEIRI